MRVRRVCSSLGFACVVFGYWWGCVLEVLFPPGFDCGSPLWLVSVDLLVVAACGAVGDDCVVGCVFESECVVHCVQWMQVSQASVCSRWSWVPQVWQ
jgi:hypothetical protein